MRAPGLSGFLDVTSLARRTYDAERRITAAVEVASEQKTGVRSQRSSHCRSLSSAPLLLDPHGTPLGVRLMKYDTPIPMTAGAAAIAAMAHMPPSVTGLKIVPPSMTRDGGMLKIVSDKRTVSSEP